MRVLHVLPSAATSAGGPASQVVGAARALTELGVETTIFSSDLAAAPQAPRQQRTAPVLLPSGADELDLELFQTRFPGRWVFSPQLWRALRRRVREYDVVHIHSLFVFPQLAAYLAASRAERPYIVAPCGALAPYLRSRRRALKAVTDRAWQRRMLDGAAAIHYKTVGEARAAADLGLRPPAAVVPNGIDWASFQAPPSAAAFREANGVARDEPLVLSIGRISRRKGYDVLIAAFGRVLAERPTARLMLAGPDDEALIPELRRLAVAGGFADRVGFPGMLGARDRLAALAAADVWALPSQGENFGTVVLEAMATATATVISEAVALADEIADAGAGVVAELAPEAFAREICALLEDPRHRESVGEAGREFARRFDWAEVVHRLVDMYSAAMRGDGIRSRRPLAASTT